LPPDVFQSATVTPVLIFLIKEKPKQNHRIELVEYKEEEFKKLSYKLNYERIVNSPKFNFSFNPEVKFNIPTIKLSKIAKFSLGIKTSDDRKFISNSKKDENSYPLLRGKDVGRYAFKYADKWIWYKPKLMMEKVGAGPREPEYFKKNKKILIKDVAQKIITTLDDKGYFTNDTLSLIYEVKNYDIKFILSLLNSELVNEWFETNFEAGLHIKINQLKQIPIPKIDFKNKKEKAKHDGLIKLADKMLKLNKELQKLHPILDEEEYKEIESEIKKTDKIIDQKVYKLYGLNNEEIKIIENYK
jgi:hypothetical protein